MGLSNGGAADRQGAAIFLVAGFQLPVASQILAFSLAGY
jgi:hypothetical protein